MRHYQQHTDALKKSHLTELLFEDVLHGIESFLRPV